jgi:hypothetical protein
MNFRRLSKYFLNVNVAVPLYTRFIVFGKKSISCLLQVGGFESCGIGILKGQSHQISEFIVGSMKLNQYFP